MSTTPPPLPPKSQFIARTRETCASVREHSGIKVNTLAIDAHLKSLDRKTFDRLKSSHGVSFPLTFPTVQSEINFLAVLALLNTLSAYRAPFHASTGQGAYQNVIKLLFGLYISSNDQEGTGLLSARGLETLDAQTISSIWGVSTFEEKPHPDLPGVTVGTQGGVMHEIVQMVVQVCNETGRILREEGWKDLGEFAASVLEEAEGMEEAEMADWVVQKIVTLIPGFRDMSTVLDPPEPVYIFKKVFFLLFALHQRLPLRKSEGEKVPRVPAPSVLPMFVDNVLPTMSVHLGFVDLSECTLPALRAWGATPTTTTASTADADQLTDATKGGKKKIQEGPSLTREEAYIVRAATVDAGRIAVERAHALAAAAASDGDNGLGWLAQMTEADLDGYLWSVAKDDPELRKVPRMVELGTIMY